MAAAELEELAIAHRERIIELALAGGVDADRRDDHARWLGQVIDDLASAVGTTPEAFVLSDHAAAIARRHGAARRAQGVPMQRVVGDFGAICDAICKVAQESHVDLSAAGVRVLNMYLDGAIASALEPYACADDADDTPAPDLGEALAIANAIAVVRTSFDALRTGRVGIHSRTADLLDRSIARVEGLVREQVEGLVAQVRRAR